MKVTTKTVSELIESGESPLKLDVIPNHMGINLCSVEALTWVKQDDDQLVSLTIHFIPVSKKKSEINEFLTKENDNGNETE